MFERSLGRSLARALWASSVVCVLGACDDAPGNEEHADGAEHAQEHAGAGTAAKAGAGGTGQRAAAQGSSGGSGGAKTAATGGASASSSAAGKAGAGGSSSSAPSAAAAGSGGKAGSGTAAQGGSGASPAGSGGAAGSAQGGAPAEAGAGGSGGAASAAAGMGAAGGAGHAGSVAAGHGGAPAEEGGHGDEGEHDHDDGAMVGKLTGATCPQDSQLTYASFGMKFMQDYCLRCHSEKLTGAARMNAPADHNFDTLMLVQEMSAHIDQKAGSGPRATNTAMPPAGAKPTAAERKQLSEWIACGLPQ